MWDTNFDVSIRLAATYWIAIVWRQSWRSNWMVAGTTTVRPNARQKSVERACRPGRDCVAVLEPSSSVRTRQRLEINLVCVGEKAFVATTLTSILSLPKGEADFVRRRRNKRGGTSKCEKTAQAVTSKSQISVFKSPITIFCRAVRRMGLASARDSRPPRPACGERIEVRGFFVRVFRFNVRRYNGLS